MTKNSETLSIILGILWGAIPLSYWLTGTPNPSYISIIAVYIGAILVGSVRSIPRSAVIMLSITSILFSISTMNELGSAIEVRSYFTLGLFAVNLSLMLAIIQPERTNTFLALFFKTTSACAMLHIFLVFAGQVEDHFGRYFFLGNAHSNLGGEIYAIASFAGAVSTKRKSMLIFSAPLTSNLITSREGAPCLYYSARGLFRILRLRSQSALTNHFLKLIDDSETMRGLVRPFRTQRAAFGEARHG